jgi:hypothetical protein
MRTLPIIILFALCYTNSLSQKFDVGKTRKVIESKARSAKGANISFGMNEEGLVYMMDEGHDGMVAWYFNDADICIAHYLKFHSEEGRRLILGLKKSTADFDKIDDTLYCGVDYCWKFSVPSPPELALLIYQKKE